MPNIANSDGEIISCFETMAELRPHLIKDNFLTTIRALEKSGYKLLYIEDEFIVVAVAGYRIAFNLFKGKHLYIDDLVTAESAQSKGYGEALVSRLRNLALNEGCSYLHLDSGTHRGRAHKFYFEQGLTITSYHFSEHLESQ